MCLEDDEDIYAIARRALLARGIIPTDIWISDIDVGAKWITSNELHTKFDIGREPHDKKEG